MNGYNYSSSGDEDKDVTKSASALAMEELNAQEKREEIEQGFSTHLHAFLRLRGIPEHKHVSQLTEATALSRQSIHRKLKGEVHWAASELMMIADHYGVSLPILLGRETGSGAPASGRELATTSEDEVFTMVSLPRCTETTGSLVVGDMLMASDKCDLVAFQDGETWRVTTQNKALKGVNQYGVARLTLASPAHIRVAILEDSQSLAESLSDELGDLGFQPTVFNNSRDFLTDLPGSRFQAFVLDWDLGGTTSEEALKAIRIREIDEGLKQAPIVIMTGTLQGVAAGAAERALYPAAERLNADIQTKPAPTSLLARRIRRALG